MVLAVFAVTGAAHADDGQNAAGQNTAGKSAHITAKLVTASPAVPAGGDVVVALDYTSAPGWHTYWVNPGDTGLAPKITWSLPDGFSAGDIDFPTPKPLPTFGLMSYGYEGRTVLLIRLHNGGHFDAGAALPIKAHVDFLVCADVCVPESLDVATPLAIGPTAKGPGSDTVAKAQTALPKVQPISRRP